MLDLPVEYLTAIIAMSTAIAWITRQYILDLKAQNVYIRDTVASTQAAQLEVMKQLDKRLDDLEGENRDMKNDFAEAMRIQRDILAELRRLSSASPDSS